MGWGFRNINIYGGMKILWIFWGVTTKLDWFKVSLLCILGSFLKVNAQNENIFAWQKFQIFFGVLDIPDFFFFGGKR